MGREGGTVRAVRAQALTQREGCVRFLEVLAVYRAWGNTNELMGRDQIIEIWFLSSAQHIVNLLAQESAICFKI